MRILCECSHSQDLNRIKISTEHSTCQSCEGRGFRKPTKAEKASMAIESLLDYYEETLDFKITQDYEANEGYLARLIRILKERGGKWPMRNQQ